MTDTQLIIVAIAAALLVIHHLVRIWDEQDNDIDEG